MRAGSPLRIAIERHNPYFPPGERERRAAAHTAEAERLERIAEQDREAASD